MSKFTASTNQTRLTQFSLPADHSASSILRRFVREIARGTDMTSEDVADLQLDVTKAFCHALNQQACMDDGHILVTIHSVDGVIHAELTYREPQLALEEFQLSP